MPWGLLAQAALGSESQFQDLCDAFPAPLLHHEQVPGPEHKRIKYKPVPFASGPTPGSGSWAMAAVDVRSLLGRQMPTDALGSVHLALTLPGGSNLQRLGLQGRAG